jgi:outer membrane murein-binding lipoprotein Lpp
VPAAASHLADVGRECRDARRSGASDRSAREASIQQPTGESQMNAKALIAAVVVAGVALGGCASTQTGGSTGQPVKVAKTIGKGKLKSAKCDKNTTDCEVVITVDTSAKPPKVQVDAEYLSIAADRQDKTIYWRIDTGGFAFDAKKADGIVFDLDSTRPKKEFDCSPQGAKIKCDNNASGFGVYKYIINVVDAQGNLISLDPYVIND